MEMIKEDPPTVSKSEHYFGIADTLRGDSGNWYRVAEMEAYSILANRIKRGLIVAFRPAGTFEATARRTKGTNNWTIWARHVGEGIEE